MVISESEKFFEEANPYTKHSLSQSRSKTFAFLTWYKSTLTQTLGVLNDFHRHWIVLWSGYADKLSLMSKPWDQDISYHWSSSKFIEAEVALASTHRTAKVMTVLIGHSIYISKLLIKTFKYIFFFFYLLCIFMLISLPHH